MAATSQAKLLRSGRKSSERIVSHPINNPAQAGFFREAIVTMFTRRVTSLSLGASLLLGLAASGHCLAMCGGISAALGVVTARGADGEPRRGLLAAYQFGRVLSYVLAGLLFATVAGGAIAWLDDAAIRTTLRVLVALVQFGGALVAFGLLRDTGHAIGRIVWPRLAPLGRRLIPVTTLPRAVLFGMLWGGVTAAKARLPSPRETHSRDRDRSRRRQSGCPRSLPRRSGS